MSERRDNSICKTCIFRDVAKQCRKCKHRYESLPDLFCNADAFFESVPHDCDICSYPDNLYRDIEGISKTEYILRPCNLKKNMKVALNSLESKRETEILKYRFELGMTYKQIGRVFDLSHERIRQIEHNAIRKLRCPNRRMIIRYGITEFCKQENLDTDSTLSNINLAAFDELAKTDIIVLNLPVNIYGSLIRAGISTIDELTHSSIDRLLKVRGIGPKNIKKIEEAINNFARRKESDFVDE